MKRKNRENISKGLTIVLSIAMPLLIVNCPGSKTENVPDDTLTFEGTLESLAPDVGILSGRIAVFRLAKYRVKKVCQGNYSGKEIIVDHLILNGREFDGVNVGDRVCVSVKISDRIVTRYNAEGIRSPKDTVKIFYVGGGVAGKDQASSCPCS
jgi:hypothetical protein